MININNLIINNQKIIYLIYINNLIYKTVKLYMYNLQIYS
jgi:hypothetical protein